MARVISFIALLLAPVGFATAVSAEVPWNAYTSTKAGFSLRYPAFWEPVADLPPGVAFQAADPRSPSNGNCSVSVGRMEVVGLVTPKMVLAQMNGSMLLSSFRRALPDARLIDSEPDRLGGSEGFSVVIEATKSGGPKPELYRMMFILTYQGQQKYTLLCGATAIAYPDVEPVFRRVRDSFRFGGVPAGRDGRDIANYVNGVGRGLAGAAGVPDLSFTVTDSTVPDIQVLMGPRIAVSLGLLDALQSEAELAAVLANEVAHVARHDRGAPYAPEDEAAADRMAVDYLAQNDYNTAAAVEVQWRFLAYRDDNRPGWSSGIFTHHPPSEARLAALRDAVGKVNPGGIEGREYYQKIILSAAGLSVP